MQEPPPPFHSRNRSRTRPARRRSEAEPTPDLARVRRRLARSSVAIAALIAVVGIGTAALSRGRSEAPAPAAVPPEGAVAVAVTRVIDGDTLDVSAGGTALRVRLYGVDTPERDEPCYLEATQRLTALAGDRVLLVADRRQTDPNGRELRYVFTEQGESIDAALVREGLALAWREDGARRDALVDLEATARASQTGCLWSGRN